jgi:cell division protein FtsB
VLQTSQKELTRLQTKNSELDKQLQLVESPEFIEKEAREKLNLAKPGETIILIGQPSSKEEQQKNIPTETNWRMWWNEFF